MITAASASAKAIPQSRSRLERAPTVRSEARSVRAAKAVPTCPITIPRKVIDVACR